MSLNLKVHMLWFFVAARITHDHSIGDSEWRETGGAGFSLASCRRRTQKIEQRYNATSRIESEHINETWSMMQHDATIQIWKPKHGQGSAMNSCMRKGLICLPIFALICLGRQSVYVFRNCFFLGLGICCHTEWQVKPSPQRVTRRDKTRQDVEYGALARTEKSCSGSSPGWTLDAGHRQNLNEFLCAFFWCHLRLILNTSALWTQDISGSLETKQTECKKCTTMYDILQCSRWRISCIELLCYPQKTISGFLYASQDGYWHLCSETAAVKSDQKSIGKSTWLTWTFSSLHRSVWTKNMYPRITSNMAHLKRRIGTTRVDAF